MTLKTILRAKKYRCTILRYLHIKKENGSDVISFDIRLYSYPGFSQKIDIPFFKINEEIICCLSSYDYTVNYQNGYIYIDNLKLSFLDFSKILLSFQSSYFSEQELDFYI